MRFNKCVPVCVINIHKYTLKYLYPYHPRPVQNSNTILNYCVKYLYIKGYRYEVMYVLCIRLKFEVSTFNIKTVFIRKKDELQFIDPSILNQNFKCIKNKKYNLPKISAEDIFYRMYKQLSRASNKSAQYLLMYKSIH
jgi:hypothetical protein